MGAESRAQDNGHRGRVDRDSGSGDGMSLLRAVQVVESAVGEIGPGVVYQMANVTSVW